MVMISLQELNKMSEGTLMATLGIRYTTYDGETLSAEMPVGPRIHQPNKALHGGATAALAESVGSALSFSHVDRDNELLVGIEINVNHIRPVMNGTVTATARFLHRGNTIHVVDIRVEDENGNLVAVSRLTNKIVRK